MKCPCSTCVRVKDPSKCENKQCDQWRKWFVHEWARLHGKFAGSIQKEN